MENANRTDAINTLSLLCGAMGLVRSPDDVRILFFNPAARGCTVQLLDDGRVLATDRVGADVFRDVTHFDSVVSPALEAQHAAREG